MSRSLDIFIATNLTLKEITSRVETLVTTKFHREVDGGEVYYEYKSPALHLTIGENDLINDRDLNFEDYQFTLGIWASGNMDGDERIVQQNFLGQEIFRKLREFGEFRIMLVDDVQRKLDEFNPLHENQTSTE